MTAVSSLRTMKEWKPNAKENIIENSRLTHNVQSPISKLNRVGFYQSVYGRFQLHMGCGDVTASTMSMVSALRRHVVRIENTVVR